MDTDQHEKLSREETLTRAGYDSEAELAERVLYGRQTGVPAMCTCGSFVEVDGACPHGNPSVLRGVA